MSAGADVNLKRNDGASPLAVASQEGHTDCVNLLLQHAANVEETDDYIGATPLYWAAFEGHTEVVQFLIEQHADVNACCSTGASCLWTASFNGHTDVCLLYTSDAADE